MNIDLFGDLSYSTDGCRGDTSCDCPYHMGRDKWETRPEIRKINTNMLLVGETDVDEATDPDDVILDPNLFVKQLFQEEDLLDAGIRRVKTAIEFLETCYRIRREQESVLPVEGEEPLYPWSIDFTRKIHYEFLCMALPHIVGLKIFERHQAELMELFGLDKINKAVAVIMARGFGKSESMVMAAALAVLCTHYAGTETAPYEILVISAKLDGAVLLMDNISKCVSNMSGSHCSSMELIIDNRIHKRYVFNAGTDRERYVDIQSISCTEKSIRGHHPHLIIVDEFCFTEFGVIEEALFPIIRETKSRTIFASTPAPEGSPWANFVQRIDVDMAESRGLFVLTRNTMCCDECRQLSPAERLLCRHLFGSLQPWRDITSVYPALTEYNDVNVALAEYMGEPPVMVGACFNSYELETTKNLPPVEAIPNETYTIHITTDPTGNSADDISGSNFAIVSWIHDIFGNAVILGVTDERISSDGMGPTRAAVETHLEALRLNYNHFEDCTVLVDVEGNAPINAQDIVKSFILNFTNHKDMHRLHFVQNPLKAKTPGHENIAPMKAELLEKGVIVIQDLIRHHKLRHYKYIFGTKGGWATLINQLGYIRREVKYASGKVTISGKGHGQRDDVGKSVLRGVALRDVTRTPSWSNQVRL